MHEQTAATLAAHLEQEAAREGCPHTYEMKEAANQPTWAVLEKDEHGHPITLWVSPHVSFPLNE